MTTGPGPHPREGEAAEYVLGTLPAEEHAAFRREMDSDADLRALVLAWQARLSPLAEAVHPVAPSDAVWRSILAALPRAAETEPSAANPSTGGEVVTWPGSAELARLRRSRSIWRGGAVAFAALAAALAAYITVARPEGQFSGQDLVAVVNRSGDLPALLVRVDRKAGLVQVRTLAAEAPGDRSLELWSVAGSAPPRSLGLVGSGLTRAPLPTGDRTALEGTVIAVSVEPAGGSKTGGPTGPVIYTGKLVRETP